MSGRLFVCVVTAVLSSFTLGTLGGLTSASAAGIAVVVVDDAGTPVPGARIFLTGLVDSLHRVVEADTAGQAQFESLPNGTFTLAAESEGFARGVFGSAVGSPPIPIALTGATQFRATVVIQRLAAVSGVVTDDAGAPVAAETRLLRYQDGSRGRLQVIASSRTSADGAFQFSSVVPGDYFVCARATGRGEGTQVPVSSCFGGLREPSGAANLRISPADQAGSVNLFVAYGAGGRLQGKVLDSNGQPSVSTQVHIARAVDDGFGITSLRTNATGEFTATLAPGAYNLVVRGAGSIEATVSPGTTTDVLFPLGRGAQLSGRLGVTGTDDKPSLPVGTTVFELVPAPSALAQLLSTIPVRITDTNSLMFSASAIPPGDYQLKLTSALSDWLPEFLTAGDRDLLVDGLRIQGADRVANVSLALARADAELTGRVIGPDDAAVFDRTVIVFPEERQHWTMASGRVRWAQPDTTGRFEIRGLPPGRFRLALIEGAKGERWSPEMLEASSSHALPISIEQGQRVIQTIKTLR